MSNPAFLVWWDGENITKLEPNDTKAWEEVTKRPPDMPITLWTEKDYDNVVLASGEYEYDHHEYGWIRKTNDLIGHEQIFVDGVVDYIRDGLRGKPSGLYVSECSGIDCDDIETNLVMEMRWP